MSLSDNLGELGLLGNARHGGNGLDGIFSVGGLATEHEGIGAVIDGVGDVGYLGTGGTGILYHRVEHLRSHDDGLLGLHTLLDEAALYAGNLLLGHFNTEVATGYHHAVSNFEYLVDIVDTLLVLDFGDNLYLAVVGIEYLLYGQHVLTVAYKRVGNEVDIFLDGVENVATVFLGEGGQVDAHTGHVDTLARTQLAGILCDTQKIVFVLFEYTEFELAIVDEYHTVDREVFGEIDIRHVNLLMSSIGIGVTGHAHDIAGRKGDGPVVLDKGRSHFGAFGIHENGYRIGDSSHVVDNTVKPFGIEVSRVHSHHIHSVFVQRAHEVYIATLVRNRSDNLSLL